MTRTCFLLIAVLCAVSSVACESDTFMYGSRYYVTAQESPTTPPVVVASYKFNWLVGYYAKGIWHEVARFQEVNGEPCAINWNDGSILLDLDGQEMCGDWFPSHDVELWDADEGPLPPGS